MAGKLLVRMFDVGLGDFIYCRIPAAHADGRDFHLVIDCGTMSRIALIEAAVKKLKRMLPEVGGKPQLDLLVITHQHKDHISGFGPPIWDEFSIGALWMTTAMNENHPQAAQARRLHQRAGHSLTRARAVGILSEASPLLASFAFDNDDAIRRLRQTLPAANGIGVDYVHAGMSTEADGGLDHIPLQDATFHIVGPENDIDRYYVGSGGSSTRLMMSDTLVESQTANDNVETVAAKPTNISAADFRQLQSRMLSSALAFTDEDSKVINNTSVVLLIVWKGRRLLFVGDAEWEGSFKDGKGNGSWNTMWNKRPELLNGPIDFLKIGHHGSENSTPWDDQGDRPAFEPAIILDAILPVMDPPTALAVVSTERGLHKTIPRSQLLSELGRRTANSKNYQEAFAAAGQEMTRLPKFDEFEKTWFNANQPPRTDLEGELSSHGFVDVEIAPL